MLCAWCVIVWAGSSPIINAQALRDSRPVTKTPNAPLSATPPAPRAQPTPNQQKNDPASRSAPRVLGAITGRVVNEGGQPMPNAEIYLSAQGRTNAAGGSTINTGDDGRFRADQLEPGAYTIFPHAPGYVPVRTPAAERGEREYFRLGDEVNISMMKGSVITGQVTDTDGRPVVRTNVRAFYLRDLHNRPTDDAGFNNQETDDRGIYRIFGLQPGIYVISAGGRNYNFSPWPSAFEADAPTYFPSHNRDGAAELTLQAGQELSGIDIRYRHQPGHTISGSLAGLPDATGSGASGVSVMLTHAATGLLESNAFMPLRWNERTFTLDGVVDGEYDLTAHTINSGSDRIASAPHRVTVRGADVTGLTLRLQPGAAISGRVQLEAREAKTPTTASNDATGNAAPPAKDACAHQPDGNSRVARAQEFVITARRDEKDVSLNQPRPPRYLSTSDTTPDEKGDFNLPHLPPGRYHLAAQPPGDDWYLRAVTLPAAQATTTPPVATIARDGFTVKSGERLNGLTVNFARGAAALQGQVVPREAGAAGLLSKELLRVHLVPAEREQADNIWRFAESALANDGTFAFKHLAPGRYHLVVRLFKGNQLLPVSAQRRVAWEADGRAQLRREAEATNIMVDLRPCQRLDNFALRFPQSASK